MPAIEYFDKEGVRRLICPNCAHDWRPMVSSPKMCPRCKKYLDKKKDIKCSWLTDNDKGSLCDECRADVAVVKHLGKKLCVRCLQKKGRL